MRAGPARIAEKSTLLGLVSVLIIILSIQVPLTMSGPHIHQSLLIHNSGLLDWFLDFDKKDRYTVNGFYWIIEMTDDYWYVGDVA